MATSFSPSLKFQSHRHAGPLASCEHEFCMLLHPERLEIPCVMRETLAFSTTCKCRTFVRNTRHLDKDFNFAGSESSASSFFPVVQCGLRAYQKDGYPFAELDGRVPKLHIPALGAELHVFTRNRARLKALSRVVMWIRGNRLLRMSQLK